MAKKKDVPPLKIRNSKNELYVVCPFIDRILELVYVITNNNKEMLPELFEINRCLEALREIAKVWQSEYNEVLYNGKYSEILANSNIALPYNYSAVLRNIRAKISLGVAITESDINEIIETYL
jgi:hypothetical protein